MVDYGEPQLYGHSDEGGHLAELPRLYRVGDPERPQIPEQDQ